MSATIFRTRWKSGVIRWRQWKKDESSPTAPSLPSYRQGSRDPARSRSSAGTTRCSYYAPLTVSLAYIQCSRFGFDMCGFPSPSSGESVEVVLTTWGGAGDDKLPQRDHSSPVLR